MRVTSRVDHGPKVSAGRQTAPRWRVAAPRLRVAVVAPGAECLLVLRCSRHTLIFTLGVFLDVALGVLHSMVSAPPPR